MSSCPLSENIIVLKLLCYKLACNGSQSTKCDNIYFVCDKYCMYTVGLHYAKALAVLKNNVISHQTLVGLYEIKAYVSIDMLNTTEATVWGTIMSLDSLYNEWC